ncbi:MAG: hypothetical protein Q9191_001247 [Dirinaria sp. TL-2023a]
MRPFTHVSSWPLPRRKYDNYEPVEDLLPPFSMLTCDEERERKAEHKVPGTYHIIVNPASFSSLEQYADSHDRTGSSPGAIFRHTDWQNPVSTPNLRQDIFEDPETLILGNFDENGCSSSSPSLTSNSSSMNHIHSAQPCNRPEEMPPLLGTVWEDGEEHRISLFYKSFVRSQLNQVHLDSLGTSAQSRTPTIPKVLDEQAPSYIPIAAAQPRGSNLWSQHLDQLLRIISLRQKMYGREVHSHILWWVFAIDTHSILSGSGQGDFAQSMLRSDQFLPYTGYFTIGSTKSSGQQSMDSRQAPSVLDFHRAILIMAARLGILARDLRQSDSRSSNRQELHVYAMEREQQVTHLRDDLRRTWDTHSPAFKAMGYSNGSVPIEARGIFEHTYALYHACIIYSYTSMWPRQRFYMGDKSIPELSDSICKVLQLGREITANGFDQRKFMVFPTFMAGIATRNPADQQLALQILKFLERNSIGKVMMATRQILEIVYEEQRELAMQGCHPMTVDWVTTVADRGLQMIDARL